MPSAKRNYTTRKVGEVTLIKFTDLDLVKPAILESYREVVPGWYMKAQFSYGNIWKTVLEGETYDSAIPLGVDFERGSVWHYPVVDGRRSTFGELLPWVRIWRMFITRLVSELYDLRKGDVITSPQIGIGAGIIVDILSARAELCVQTIGPLIIVQLSDATLVYRPKEEKGIAWVATADADDYEEKICELRLVYREEET